MVKILVNAETAEVGLGAWNFTGFTTYRELGSVWFCPLTILATFDATKPANPGFRVNILSAIQPATVYGALHGVYAGLVYGIRVIGHSK